MYALQQLINSINKTMKQNEVPYSRARLADVVVRSYIKHALLDKEPIHFVNIICPGYQRDYPVAVEDFAFKKLSEEVKDCPNVLSMIEKFGRFTTTLERHYRKKLHIKKTIILADVAILNFKELQKKQDVKKTLNSFYRSVEKFLNKKSLFNQDFINISLLKMSGMDGDFRKLPIDGYPVRLSMYTMGEVRNLVKKKAKEYMSTLIESRSNLLTAHSSSFGNLPKKEIIKISKLEVLRFLYEYGLAGKEIYRTFPRGILTFTEPSGNIRGYFYNAFLHKKDYLPVIYLS